MSTWGRTAGTYSIVNQSEGQDNVKVSKCMRRSRKGGGSGGIPSKHAIILWTPPPGKKFLDPRLRGQFPPTHPLLLRTCSDDNNYIFLSFQLFIRSWETIFLDCSGYTYGQNCSTNCTCVLENTHECDPVTGSCACLAGWQGQNCQLGETYNFFLCRSYGFLKRKMFSSITFMTSFVSLFWTSNFWTAP